MNPQRPPFLSHTDELIENIGQVISEILAQFSKLVDDDEKVRERFGKTTTMVGVNVGYLMPGQNRFPPAHFTAQGAQCPASLLAVQVGHQADGMGKIGQSRHSGPAFVIDQDEVDLMGVMIQGQSAQECKKQFALSRAGCAGD